MSFLNNLQYCTVRLIATTSTGQVQTGTGFYFNFDINTGLYAIITNKHVVQDCVSMQFLITEGDENNNPLITRHHRIVWTNPHKLTILHPDPTVDLCAILIGPVLHQLNGEGKITYLRAFDERSFLPAERLARLSPFEKVLMIGYPNGIFDEVNNLPLARTGITATNLAIDYMGRKEFIIDAACYPGSSGSPVFLYNDNPIRSNGVQYQMVVGGGPEMYLLGALYAGPQYKVVGGIQVVDQFVQRPVAVSHIPNNLGLVIKSERILELAPLVNALS